MFRKSREQSGNLRTILAALALAVLSAAAAQAQTPLGASFTYQGQLKSGGAPLDGTADFEFRLWDALAEGAPVGSPVAVNNVMIVDGLFTVALDFGAAAFDGNARWLEIAVRSPAGSGSFETLSPRQPVTAAPYALQTRGLFVDDLGNFGIGTTTPAAPLDVVGSNPFPHARIAAAPSAPYGSFLSLDARATTGGKEYLIFSTGGTAEEGTGKLAFQNFTDGVQAMTITGTGNVGIGTTEPQSPLQVTGTITAGEAGVSDGEIVLEDSGTISNNPGIRTNIDGDLILRSHSSVGDILFETGNPESTHMTLLANGNFGIGTTTPIQRLDVAGRMHVGNGVIQRGGAAVTATSDLGLYSMSNGAWMRFVSNSAPIQFFTNSVEGTAASPAADSMAMTIAANGKVGIGTGSPQDKLTVVATGGGANGIRAISDGANGVLGESTAEFGGAGVEGKSNSDEFSVGVYGTSSTGYGVIGNSDATDGVGLWGRCHNGVDSTGIVGTGDGYGVAGFSAATNAVGVIAECNAGNGAVGVFARSTSGLAGQFEGNVQVIGAVSKTGGSFKIDHPQDPANKYLYHSFVESPDMMNIYNGQVVTDGRGYATVTLPDWFETLNRDFRYQLTIVNDGEVHDFVQAMIVRKVKDNQFTLKTSKSNIEVSWQVTGIRQDPWANAHRIPVEQVKTDAERGKYLHPELYGHSEDRGMNYDRRPEKQAARKKTLGRSLSGAAAHADR